MLTIFDGGSSRLSRHWAVFSDLCRKANARGTLVPDAYPAALAIESGCEWITTDRDYASFLAAAAVLPSCNQNPAIL